MFALPSAANLTDWINLLVRWAHLIAGIAWIGSSFYFIWLDSHLTLPESPRPDVEGELWMVHSGGFYAVEKRLVGPGRMPKVLHWFKYEALLTWITGAILLTVVYYLSGAGMLLPPGSPLSFGEGITAAVLFLAVGWLVYDGIYRSPLGRSAAATVVAGAALAAGIVLACRLFNGRAAYIHVGAIFGTIMVANVWHVILPAQKKMIAATAAGVEPDFALGRQAKRRSVHNSYMTFPVLFIMLSNHFPQTWGHPLNWLVLMLLVVAGAAVRHVMIGKGAYAKWAALPAAACVVALMLMTASRPAAAGATGEAVTFAQARSIIQGRCQRCHSRWPVDDVFTMAPNGVTFDTPEEIQLRAARIKERAVVQQTMPFMNKTGITPEERAALGRWIDQGAKLQ